MSLHFMLADAMINSSVEIISPQRQTIYLHYIGEFLDRYALLTYLIVAIVLDIFIGNVRAFVFKQLSSAASFQGMTKKAGCLFVVSLIAGIDRFTGFPMSRIVILFYLYTEAISILESCAMMGVPLPPGLLDALVKLRSNQKPPLVPIIPVAATVASTTQIFARGPIHVRNSRGMPTTTTDVTIVPGSPKDAGTATPSTA